MFSIQNVVVVLFLYAKVKRWSVHARCDKPALKFLVTKHMTFKKFPQWIHKPTDIICPYFLPFSDVWKPIVRNKRKLDTRKTSDRIVCTCRRSFLHASMYTFHMRWECGKDLRCDRCWKSFTTISNLKAHLKVCALKINVTC